ncbi:MAG: hypothetical protein E5V24_17890, partial [Mesorhizobium sp.]
MLISLDPDLVIVENLGARASLELHRQSVIISGSRRLLPYCPRSDGDIMLRIFIASSFLLAFGTPSTTLAQDSSIESETGRIAVDTFAEGLEHPWG